MRINQNIEDSQFKKEIFIECSPETLYEFLIDSEKMTRWMGKYALLEPEIGGQFRIDFNNKDVVLGEYIELIPEKKVVITWGWNNDSNIPPGSSTVEFHLHKRSNGTQLSLIHSGLPAFGRPMHAEGWDYYTLRLQIAIAGGQPGPDIFANSSP